MADPLSSLGAAALIPGIIDILSRSIYVANEVRNQWKDANLSVVGLCSQLQILRGALIEVKIWAESVGAKEIHHPQLVMELDSVLSCCRPLASRIDSKLQSLHRGVDGRLSKLAKVKLVLDGRNIDDIQKMIDRQINSLMLLMTASQSNAIHEQKRLLEQKSTRAAIDIVKRDSAALVVHRDTSLCFTTHTDKLSKVSRVFGFKDELRSSKVNNRAWRSTFISSLPLRTEPANPDAATVDRYRSLSEVGWEEITINIILLGASNTTVSQSILMQQIMLIMDEPSSQELSEDRRKIWRSLIIGDICAYTMCIYGVQEKDDGFSAQYQSYFDDIGRHCELRRLDELLLPTLLRHLSELWCNDQWREKVSKYRDHTNLDYSYFMQNLNRIFSPSYIPSVQDIFKSRIQPSGVNERTFRTDGYSIHLFDMGRADTEWEKRKHALENADIILFHASIRSYDELSARPGSALGENQLAESLKLFRSIRDSRWWGLGAALFLNFTEMDIFKQKTSRGLTRPPREQFPYDGNLSDGPAMRDLITKVFVGEGGTARLKDIPVSYLDVTDTEQVKGLLDTVQGVLRGNE